MREVFVPELDEERDPERLFVSVEVERRGIGHRRARDHERRARPLVGRAERTKRPRERVREVLVPARGRGAGAARDRERDPERDCR